MRRKACATVLTAMFTALPLVGASAATAATQVGNACIGDRGEPGLTTLTQLASTTNPASVTIPQSGVITKWSVGVISYPGGISEKLKVFRPAPGSNTFTVVGESTMEPIISGTNSFETRVPVEAGDHLGVTASPYGIYCEGTSTPSDVMGTFTSDPLLGSTVTFAEQPKGQVAVAATVEPDADGDGYGDETQDKCPQNAAFQTPCPVVTLSASSIVKKSLATVLVSSSFQAPVTVAGTVKLGRGKTAKLNGGTQIVAPGVIAKFTLLFPGKLKAKLKQLGRKQFLSLNLAVTAPNPVGAISSRKLKAKLKGQAKPKRHT